MLVIFQENHITKTFLVKKKMTTDKLANNG